MFIYDFVIDFFVFWLEIRVWLVLLFFVFFVVYKFFFNFVSLIRNGFRVMNVR